MVRSTAVPSGVVDPDGQWFAQGPADGSEALVIAELDPSVSESAGVAVKYRRPWRQKVRSGIYNEHFVTDPRGQDRTRF